MFLQNRQILKKKSLYISAFNWIHAFSWMILSALQPTTKVSQPKDGLCNFPGFKSFTKPQSACAGGWRKLPSGQENVKPWRATQLLRKKKNRDTASNTVLKGFLPKSLRPGALCLPAPSCHGHWAHNCLTSYRVFFIFSEARKSFCRINYPGRAAGLAVFVKQLLNPSTNTWHWAGAGPGNIHQDLLLRYGMVLWVEKVMV